MNAHASTSRISLDLDCPLAWPTSSTSTNADAIEQPRASLDGISERYHHALYLGEQHTPLSSFVGYCRRSIAQKGAEESRASLLGLLRSAPPQKQRELLKLDALTLRALASASEGYDDEVERIRWAALASGPGSVVREEIRSQQQAELRRKEEEERQETQVARMDEEEEEVVRHGTWARKWVAAIESRDLQLQALVLLLLLRISAEHPEFDALPSASQPAVTAAAAAADSSTSAPSSDALVDSQGGSSSADASNEDTGTTKKRKRTARRWNGLGGPGFPRPASGRAGGSSQGPPPSPSGSSAEEVQLWRSVDAQSLARRFERVIDRLALLGVTASLSLSSVPSPTSNSRTAGGAARLASANFGTAGRVRAPGDERDELQWLCVEIVEPYFSRALPRQVEVLRSRAFVPGLPGATPARRPRLISGNSTLGTPVSAGAEANSSPIVGEQEEKALASAADLDLSRRKTMRAKAEREAEARRLAKRPKLAEALRKEGSKTSAAGASAAKREMKRAGAREVSVGARQPSVGLSARGSWERSTSLGPGFVESSGGAAPAEENSASLGPTLNAATSRINKRKALAHRRLDNVGTLTSTAAPSAASSSSSASASTMRNWRRAESQPVGSRLFSRTASTSAAAVATSSTATPGFGSQSQTYAQTQPLDDPLAWSDDEDTAPSQMSAQRAAPRVAAQAQRFGRAGSISTAASLAGGSTRGPFTRADSQPVAALAAHTASEKRSVDTSASQRSAAAGEDADMEMLVTRKRVSAKPLFTWSASQQQSQSQSREDAWGEVSQQADSQSQDASMGEAMAAPPPTAAAKRSVSGRNPFAARASLSSIKAAPLEKHRSAAASQPVIALEEAFVESPLDASGSEEGQDEVTPAMLGAGWRGPRRE